jgi:hypothetical protein
MIVTHNENSLVNLLFSEIDHFDLINGFIDKIIWRNHSKSPFESARDADIHLQLGLGNKYGFGTPDVIIRVNYKEKDHVIIIEAKLGKYCDDLAKPADPKKPRFFNTKNKNNSKNNNQLTLRYRAFRAINSLNSGDTLEESDNILEKNSFYKKDKKRYCKHPSVIKAMKNIIKNMADFYLVALTDDDSSPFGDLSNQIRYRDPRMPLFFDPNTNRHDRFANLGSINWKSCMELFNGKNNRFVKAYDLFRSESKEVSKNSKEAFPKEESSVLIIRKKIDGKYYHLSRRRNFSFRIRKITDKGFKIVKRGTKSEEEYKKIWNIYEKIEDAPEKRLPKVDEIKYWKDYFQQKNGI